MHIFKAILVALHFVYYLYTVVKLLSDAEFCFPYRVNCVIWTVFDIAITILIFPDRANYVMWIVFDIVVTILIMSSIF